MLIYSPLISFVSTVFLIKVLLGSNIAKKIIDVPNERSLHSGTVPRVGGVALIIGVMLGWMNMYGPPFWWILTPFIALFLVSVLDDMHSLSVRWRLLVQMSAAVYFWYMSGLMVLGIIQALAIILFVVWVTNLFNFMDGSDGLSGGMTLIGFAIYGIAALFGKNEYMALLNFTVSASAGGFLIFNFHPAKIFMGDAGSIPLGFLSAAMGLLGWQHQLWPMWFPLLVFSPFIVDATVTLFKRSIRGEKIWQAHREHYYQRMLMLGVGHRNTALLEYALMLGTGISALWALQHPTKTIYVLLIWIVVCTLAMIWVDVMWKRKCINV